MNNFENNLNKRIHSLKEDIEAGYEYKHNQDVKDNHIQRLEENIANAAEGTDVTLHEKELDDFRSQKYNAEILDENLEHIEKLEATQELINILK